MFIYTGLVDDGQRDPPAERKLISRVALLGHVLTPILVLLHNPAQHSTTCFVHVIVGCNWTCDEVFSCGDDNIRQFMDIFGVN